MPLNVSFDMEKRLVTFMADTRPSFIARRTRTGFGQLLA